MTVATGWAGPLVVLDKRSLPRFVADPVGRSGSATYREPMHRRRLAVPVTVLLGLALTACGSTVQVRSERTLGSVGSDAGAGISGAVGTTDGVSSGTSSTGGPTGTTSSAPGAAQPAGTRPPGGTAAAAGSGSGLPAGTGLSGVGFDAKNAYIGVEYIEGGDAFLSSAGFSSLTTGDAKAVVDLMLRDVNARGGVLGRKIQAVYQATNAADGSSNPQSTAQQACSAFTDDRKVVAAVIVSPAQACLSRKRVANVFVSTTTVDDQELATTAPYSRRTLALSWSRLAPVLIDRLAAQGFLSRSSKVGLLYPSSVTGTRVFDDLKRRLTAAGYQVAASFGYDSTSATTAPTSVPNAVLPFRSAGVDRVIATDATVAYFMIAAEQQGYRPRYALNSYQNLASVQESVPPAAQLKDAVGIGWLGPNDVDVARMDVKPPAFDTCRNYLRRSGQDVSGFALVTLLSYCDSLRLFLYAAGAGGGFDSASIQRGLAERGTGFPSALVLESALSATRMDGALAVRDVRYDGSCSCFRYSGTRRYRA